MSTATIANICVVFALLGAAGTITRWLSRRARAQAARRDQFIRGIHEQARTAAVLDPLTLAREPITPAGPPLPIDVTAHLVAYVLDHPDLADGFARLDQTIREQTKREQQ